MKPIRYVTLHNIDFFNLEKQKKQIWGKKNILFKFLFWFLLKSQAKTALALEKTQSVYLCTYYT